MNDILAQKPRSLCCSLVGEPASVPSKESSPWPPQLGGHRIYVLRLKGFHIPGHLDIPLTSLSSYPQEKRIYDLKKKNQELEKFKFVLDYKIKELKKQIEPRENEIKVMKEQIQEVRSHPQDLASRTTLPSPASPGWPRGNEKKLCAQLLVAPSWGQPPLHRGCHRKAQLGVQLYDHEMLWDVACWQGEQTSLWGGFGSTSTLMGMLWPSEKPQQLGLQPPGGNVYSATSLWHQKTHPLMQLI